jgi:hypothetical protein
MTESVPRVRRFFVVQPYGRDKGREATVVYEAWSPEEAFAEIDRLAEEMKRTGAPSDAIELLVADQHGRIIRRGGH